MPKPSLLKAQGQGLAEAIERAGFDRADFELTAREWHYHRPEYSLPHYTDAAPTLVHKPTDSYFMFVEVPMEDREAINHGADFWAQWSPGDVTKVKSENGLFWDALTDAVEGWLANVRMELTGPDVWAELAQEAVARIERGG